MEFLFSVYVSHEGIGIMPVKLVLFFLIFQTPSQPSGQPYSKFSVSEACDRIKEEFNYLQAQYHRFAF